VEALARVLLGADLERHEIDPQAFGGQPIGHFGFFKARFEHSLWLEAVRFFTRLFQEEGTARTSSVEDLAPPPRTSAQEQVIEAAEQGIVGMFQALRPHRLGGV
jgi:hypothetical protein